MPLWQNSLKINYKKDWLVATRRRLQLRRQDSSGPVGKILAFSDIEPLVLGCEILAAGGGFAALHGLLVLSEQYRLGARVELIAPRDLPDDWMVAPVMNLGAPLVEQERIADPLTQVRAIEKMEDLAGVSVDALLAVQIGGGNAFQPLYAAAHMNLPVVDADFMGRAFPEVQMTTPAIHNIPVYQAVVVDPRGNEITVDEAISWLWLERLCRHACTALGSAATLCFTPCRGQTIKSVAIHGSFSRALRLGQALQAAHENHEDPVEAIRLAGDGVEVCAGTIEAVERRAGERFPWGKARLRTGKKGNTPADLFFTNEWAMLEVDGHLAATVPELIYVCDAVTGQSVATDKARTGQHVRVLVLPVDPVLTSEMGIARVGPWAFGFDRPFATVFQETSA